MHLSYTSEEQGIPFPKPMKVQVDNTTAELFAKGTVKNSKLRHIDLRQLWVKTLRDKNIVLPVHVHTDNNLADIFTKILDENKFTQLRSKLMRERPTIKME